MIWLARHGETTWNLAGRYQGRLESALTALGMTQAHALADAFEGRMRDGGVVPTRVVSSPMLRCTATALPSAQRLRCDVETDARLIEIAHGTWDGRYRDDLAREDPQRYATWRNDPARATFVGGESLADVTARWRAFAADVLADDRPTLVVAHDAVLRCALLDVTERSLDDFWTVPIENGAYAMLERSATGLRVVTACVVDHLASSRADAATQAL